jgi:fructokinase
LISNKILAKFREKMQILWGIDLGGTKIEGIVLNTETNQILARPRVATEGHLGADHVINQIKKLVDLLQTETGLSPTKIGFCTPGTIDPSSQTMKNSNIVCLNGLPVKSMIETALGLPIEMANDANCFALAEANLGAAKGMNAKVVFGVILGTGVGGGVVIDGKVVNGRHGIGGEWGHLEFDKNGERCFCGKIGCNETVFAGPALQKYYLKLSGKNATMAEIYQNHKAGNDTHATATIHFLIACFGKAISNIINVLDPEIIVLGGGLSNIEELYSQSHEAIAPHIFNNRKVETLILPPKLGDSAGVFGAVELVREQ